MIETKKQPKLSKLRSLLLPIHNQELKKFIPMAGLLFFTIFNLTGMRNIKDVLILSAPGSGAEVLPFLKLCIMPLVILFSIIYVKLNKSFGFKKTYFIVIGMFLAFIGLFTFALYPYHACLHPTQASIMQWQASFPIMHWFIGMAGAWVFCLYYLCAELWSTFCLSVLFWQFANNTVSTQQAKRFYPLFILLGNFAPILLDQIVRAVSIFTEHEMFTYLNICFLVSGVCLLLLFSWVNCYGVTDEIKPVKKKKKVKLSTWQSFKQVFQSEYIAYIAILVLCYGVLINVIEVSWKSQVKLLYPSAKEQIIFFSGYFRWLGIVTIGLNYFSKGFINRCGWITGAIATPLMVGIFGGGFFLCVLGIGQLEHVMGYFNISALEFVVSIGTIGVILSKSAKYSFFDPSKEMVFIPLDDDLKTTGKAAVDGVGGRLGKTGGSTIQVAMIALTGVKSMILMANKFVYIVFGLSGLWVWSVMRLNTLYAKLLHQEEAKKK